MSQMPRDQAWWCVLLEILGNLPHGAVDSPAPFVVSPTRRDVTTVPLVLTREDNKHTGVRHRLVVQDASILERHYFPAENVCRAMCMLLFGLKPAPDGSPTLPPALELLHGCIPKEQAKKLHLVNPTDHNLQKLWGPHINITRLQKLHQEQNPEPVLDDEDMTPSDELTGESDDQSVVGTASPPGSRALTLALATVLQMWLSSRSLSARLFEGTPDASLCVCVLVTIY